MTRRLAEVLCEPQEEMTAREGVCPACRSAGFIGHGRRIEPPELKMLTVAESAEVDLRAIQEPKEIEVGVCLCKDCMVVWQYRLAARWRWN
jgi:hypothetical protein